MTGRQADAASVNDPPVTWVAAFFAFTFVLSVPLWWVAEVSGGFILPGLPVSGLMAFCPALAALLIVARRHGRTAAFSLLQRAFDVRRMRMDIWSLMTVGLMPLMLTVTFALMYLAGAPLPEPDISLVMVPVLFAVFFVAAVGEELGWTGYAIDPMQARWGAAVAAVLLGGVWTLWHVIPYMQTNRPPDWIAWHCVVTVATRVVMVWLYNNTGRSVFGMSVFHASGNVAYFLFPNGGSHYDAVYFAPVIVAVAVMAVLIWSPATLAGPKRSASQSD